MPRAASGRVRKNYRLDPKLIAEAQAILGTATETETIEQALDMIAFKRDAIDGIRAIAGTHDIKDIGLDDPVRP